MSNNILKELLSKIEQYERESRSNLNNAHPAIATTLEGMQMVAKNNAESAKMAYFEEMLQNISTVAVEGKQISDFVHKLTSPAYKNAPIFLVGASFLEDLLHEELLKRRPDVAFGKNEFYMLVETLHALTIKYNLPAFMVPPLDATAPYFNQPLKEGISICIQPFLGTAWHMVLLVTLLLEDAFSRKIDRPAVAVIVANTLPGWVRKWPPFGLKAPSQILTVNDKKETKDAVNRVLSMLELTSESKTETFEENM